MEQESLSPNIPLGEVSLKKREHLKINFSSKISFAQMLKWIFDIMWQRKEISRQEIYFFAQMLDNRKDADRSG